MLYSMCSQTGVMKSPIDKLDVLYCGLCQSSNFDESHILSIDERCSLNIEMATDCSLQS